MSDKVQLDGMNGSKERVAFDLMEIIRRGIEKGEYKTEEDVIALYSRCLRVVSGDSSEEIYGER